MIQPPLQRNSAAFFDLDKTILATSSSIALQSSFVDAGLLSRRAAAMSVLVHLPYLLKGADEKRMDKMAEAIGDLAKGMNASLLEATVESSLGHAIDPVCFTQALEEIQFHHDQMRPVVVASASVIEIVRPIGKMLGADACLGSIAEVNDDGEYTGTVLHYNQAANKAAACEELAAKRGWNMDECWAYSDSVSDIPLLSSVGHPIAVNPDKGLREAAVKNGWEIMRFTSTAAVHRTIRTPSRRTLAMIGAGVAIGAATVGYVTAKRA